MSPTDSLESRRPLKTRQKRWAQALARAVCRTPLTPNAISLLSVVFSCAAGVCIWQSGQNLGQHSGTARALYLVCAAVAIQMRLLCNLLDGMVAVEGGKASKTGDIFNDLPDRFSDLLILVPAGYALGARAFTHELGWLAGVLAVLTAYVRMLGASLGPSLGLKQDFSGPMGKPQRMAVMTAACLLATIEPLFGETGLVVETALLVVALGSAVTVLRRTMRLAHELRLR